MIKSIAICGGHQCNKATKGQHDRLLVGAKAMIEEVTGRDCDIDEMPHRHRSESWAEGSYNYDDQVIVSNAASDEHKQIKVALRHTYPHYESYHVQFNLHWNKLAWLIPITKLLKKEGVEAVEVTFDDNTLGQFLMQNWARTHYIPLAAFEKLCEQALAFEKVIKGLSLEPIWIDECLANNAGEHQTNLAVLGLIASIAQADATTIRKDHRIR